ncbi:nicotinate phosphoribosyltransferase [Afifella pfennigii]|uniref:nicotinate phosphoribosyltransferase n=1 Tax=Afifella pfennigii TaxID=209897 RepID=UPI000A01F569|nr:nicotinate phosphoribosyltransferase [Afifella pfennigii]
MTEAEGPRGEAISATRSKEEKQASRAGEGCGRDILPATGALALFTDLYELRMMQAYFAEGMADTAVFTLFVRSLPAERNYLLACGLASVLDYLECLRFTAEDLDFLREIDGFSEEFLSYLKGFRFTGDVDAVPEGTPVFANEPILEVVAPIAEAQLIETLVMNQLHHQTVVASKASRIVEAARGRPVVDFGARRMHGIDAALKAVRACAVAGVAATSNVLGARHYGLAASGTMAHSYIQAHADELGAFRGFMRLYPETVLLVDTYDTLRGVARVIELAGEMGPDFKVSAVRLDSGDLAELARRARTMLDEAGLHKVQIFASGGLDEYAVAELLAAGAPIDGFGVGTRLGVSSDRPDLDIVYKLAEYAGKGRIKLSTGKPILPGRKQIFRREEDGRAVEDVIALARESHPGRPLLQPVMRKGRRVGAGHDDLQNARARAAKELARLPASLRGVDKAEDPYRVTASEELRRAQADIRQGLLAE